MGLALRRRDRHLNLTGRRSTAEEAHSCGLVLPALERADLGELMALRDADEGIAAFLEERAPRWEDA